jgi:hypothetical protein
VDFTGAVGLNSCRQGGPSIIDHRTLQSFDELPETFLRGIGLPDTLITYLPSILRHAIEFYSCFISYSTKDRDFADRLHADLQRQVLFPITLVPFATVRAWKNFDADIGPRLISDGLSSIA